MAPFLLLGAPMNQRRPEQRDAEPGKRHRHAGALQFLLIDDVLQNRRAASAVFARPVNSHPAAFIKLLVPANPRLPVALALVGEGVGGRHRILSMLFEPRPKLGAK